MIPGRPRLPPAIPNDRLLYLRRPFPELHCKVTVFDDMDREVLRKNVNHYPKTGLEGQEVLHGW